MDIQNELTQEYERVMWDAEQHDYFVWIFIINAGHHH